jgi:hypothetical protein
MRTELLGLCMLLSWGVLGGCAPADDQPPVTVPTPQMPAGWQVVENLQFSPAELIRFSSRINAKVLGVRNTSFAVDSLGVRVNTIITANPALAQRVMGYLKNVKPEQFLLQRGATIYEFVGTNAVNHLVSVGKQHLKSQ